MTTAKKIKAIKQAVASGVLESLPAADLDMLYSTVVDGSQDTWLPPHIKSIRRETLLGAVEIILYNSLTTNEEDALERDGYDTDVMVMDDSVYRHFFAKQGKRK